MLLGNYNLKENVANAGMFGNIGSGSGMVSGSDSFGKAQNIGVSDQTNSVHRIPDASEFAGKSNFNENESIISLEDNGYSKY